MATDVPRIAVGQMCASSDVEKNFEVVADLCSQAKDRGCAMLFLPECFAFIGVKGTDALAVMEPLDGPLLGRYRELAAKHRLWLSLGGFPETGPDRGDRRFNAHVIVDASGEIRASYRKIHLFDVDMGDVNGPVLMESRTAAAGETLVTCDSPAGKLGLTVCYDLRFPEMFARLRYELGCEMMLVPSAFTKPTGQAHWETLLRARAIETQSYVVAAAQAPPQPPPPPLVVVVARAGTAPHELLARRPRPGRLARVVSAPAGILPSLAPRRGAGIIRRASRLRRP